MGFFVGIIGFSSERPVFAQINSSYNVSLQPAQLQVARVKDIVSELLRKRRCSKLLITPRQYRAKASRRTTGGMRRCMEWEATV